MSLNNKEIDLILSELNLEGLFIQKIIQPSYSALALYLYGNSPLTLFISLEAGNCRLHATQQKIPKPDKPIRFMELLRSRVKGLKITSAKQLNQDRIIKLVLSGAKQSEVDNGAACKSDLQALYFLYIRLWSSAANIILTDTDDIIIDAFYRRPKRNEVSGGKFLLPVKSEKLLKEYSIREYDKSKTFNQSIELWYLNNGIKISHTDLIIEAENLYNSRIEKLKQTINLLEKKHNEFLNAEQLKNIGDLLLSNLYLIKKGMPSIQLEDYTNGGAYITIELDPLKTPQENANFYYGKYKKAISGLAGIEDDIASARRKINKLTEDLEKLKNEKNPYLIQKIINKEKIPLQKKILTEKKIPGIQFNCSGWSIFVGRTAGENDELLRRFVRGSDLWLHTRDYAGGYVFVKSKSGKSIPVEILIKAGTLAVFYSKARKNGQADLYTAQVKYLRRAKNAPKGTVLPSNEKNLLIKLDEKILKELETERVGL